MTDLRTVRASGPADLLALVPSLLGFHPDESVVVLTLGDARHPFHARVDLPREHVAIEQLAGYLAEVASRHGVTRLAAVLYTRDVRVADAVARGLDHRLDRAGVDLVCVVRADGERWWAFDGREDSPGTPYDVGSHPLMARAVVEGTVVLGSREELADSLVGDPAEADRVGRLAAARHPPRGRAPTRRHLVREGHWVRGRVCRFLDDGQPLDAADLARLLSAIGLSLEVRDVAWAEMSHDNAERHVDLWRDAVRRAPDGLRAGPAALLGFAAWLSGNGALAWCAVERAQEAEPGHGLAALLTQALAGAVPPSVWRPIPREALTLLDP
jgi:Domain of unknown function (DUF4192)